MVSAQLIALDWGSTGFRAFLIGANGTLLETRTAALGASVLNSRADYAVALYGLCSDWVTHRPDLKILACGMVGSKHGWQEVPYALCPGGITGIAAGIQQVAGQPVHIVPGLLYQPESTPPDVMRGEETQIIGALLLHPELTERSCLIMPGTHSKWVDIEGGQIMRFATHMTGELFAVLRTHSVLGRLMPPPSGTTDLQAFWDGVDAARAPTHGGLTHQLFAVRTLGLTQKMTGAQLPDYLSGLLIGTEIREGLRWRSAAGLNTAKIALIGEPGICNLYTEAFKRFEHDIDYTLTNTAPAGLWSLAQASGMIAANQPDDAP